MRMGEHFYVGNVCVPSISAGEKRRHGRHDLLIDPMILLYRRGLAACRVARLELSNVPAACRVAIRLSHTVTTLDASHPGDASKLADFLAENPRARVRCVLGKTEGNGCVNDFTRGYASLVVSQTLGEEQRDASVIMSGGTEGVLTPHLLLFSSEETPAPESAESGNSVRAARPSDGDERLSFGASRSRELLPHEIGRHPQVLATRDAVLEACADANLDPSKAAFVQVKCPLLTPERVAAATRPCATEDAYHSMALSRGASALGVALATGELDPAGLLTGPADAASAGCGADATADALDHLVCADYSKFSRVASASAGVELMHAEVTGFEGLS